MNGETFASDQHARLFEEVVRQLEALGYRDDLLARQYGFPDWFTDDNTLRVAPAAAFLRTPHSYDSACFSVLLPNGRSGKDLVADYRALGAPFAFEIREDSIAYWRVGRDVARTRQEFLILPDALHRVFRDRESEWSPSQFSRIKNAGVELSPEQGDLFLDSGLIPALEEQIQTKLSDLLHQVIREAEELYRLRTSRALDARELFRLVFSFLTAKVLHDRGHTPFDSLSDFSNADTVLREAGYYGAETPAVTSDVTIRNLVAKALWNHVDFRNLSVEVLAYIYENTLVDDESRKTLSTHSTPHNVARYIVNHLPFEKISEHAPLVVEPFSGHGIFLVAALQRLRELLPHSMNAAQRHRYFVGSLRGYELESFALEVSRLCLMLADFPNRNGWHLYNENVFSSTRLAGDLHKAGAVLCNPPFEDFVLSDRPENLRSPLKPVEFLNRVLDNLSPTGMLGFVLPRAFLDGNSYRTIRDRLARRYDEIETVGLPDKVFHKSQQESALLIAKTPRSDRTTVSVTYTHVDDNERRRFLLEYAFTRRDSETKSLEAAQDSLAVVALREVWSHLEYRAKLADIADIHRGVEWEAPFDADKYTSHVARRGFVPGVLKAPNNQCFMSPTPIFLCTEPQYQRGRAWDRPWDRPKAVVNAIRSSRGSWRLTAFSDDAGLIFYQNFTALWPRNHWTPKTLAALLNGPVANAFVRTHERARHNRKETLEDIPVPELRSSDVEIIDSLVDKYVRLTRPESSRHFDLTGVMQLLSAKDFPLFGGGDVSARAKEALLEIDAFILKAYDLPSRKERDLLDFFQGHERAVPFSFTEYYSDSFVPAIPLWMLYLGGV